MNLKSIINHIFVFIFLISFNVNAQIITLNFTSTASNSGLFNGSIATGTFTYDDTLLLNGNEILDITHGLLAIEITVFGQTFTDADDISQTNNLFDTLPIPALSFSDREPNFLDFEVSEVEIFGFTNIRNIDLADVERFSNFNLLTESFEVVSNPSTVSNPAAIWLFGFGFFRLFNVNKRSSSF